MNVSEFTIAVENDDFIKMYTGTNTSNYQLFNYISINEAIPISCLILYMS